MTDGISIDVDPEAGRVLVRQGGRAVAEVVSDGALRLTFAEGVPATVQEAVRRHVRHLRETIRSAFWELRSHAVNQATRAFLATLEEPVPGRLNIGCGRDLRPGWTNIDFNPRAESHVRDGVTYLNWDLRFGIPLGDGSADFLHSSHFLEHLRFEEGLHLLRECRRVLKPEGTLRFALPDFKATFRAYVEDDRQLLDYAIREHRLLDHMPPFARTYADFISRSVYENYEHKYVWDMENVTACLRNAGFADIRQTDYDPAVDIPDMLRRRFSFYLTAT